MPQPTPVPPPPAATPPKKDEEGSGSGDGVSLASIGMLVAPLIAAMAALALTGTIGRVQRDEPLGISIAIGLVIASGVFWVAASTFTAPKKKEDDRSTGDIILRAVSIVLAGVGFVLALALAVSTANNEPRPQISPTLSEDGTKLTTHITASNLPTDQRLAFRIDLLLGEKPVGNVYQAYVGPDSDGNVDQTVTLPLPRREFTEIGIKAYTGTTSPSCDDFAAVRKDDTFGSGTGCVIITVPQMIDPAIGGRG